MRTQRETDLEDEVKRLTAEIEGLNAHVDVLESDDHEWYLQSERIELLEAVLVAARDVAKHIRFYPEPAMDQLDHECDSVIFIPKSHEDKIRRLLAALGVLRRIGFESVKRVGFEDEQSPDSGWREPHCKKHNVRDCAECLKSLPAEVCLTELVPGVQGVEKATPLNAAALKFRRLQGWLFHKREF